MGDSGGSLGSGPSASGSGASSLSSGAVGSVVQQGGERAGAFFSKAFGRLSSVAAGLPLPASVAPAPPPKPPAPSNDGSSSSSSAVAKPSSVTISATADDTGRPRLKKATFPLAHIAITYPFAASLPPASDQTTNSIAQVEADYARRQADEGGAEWWTEKRVGELFEWAVRIREEGMDEAVLRAIKVRSQRLVFHDREHTVS